MEPTSCTDGCDKQTGSLFCPRCGRLIEPGSLKTLRIDSFTGGQSLSPKMEKFWETGDPEWVA